jgi:hypothetical protein
MSFARELWAEYLNRHYPVEGAEPPEMERPPPGAILELIWPLLDVFRPYLAVLDETPYSEAFEKQADEALAFIALGGELSFWSKLPSGTLAVLWDRASWSVSALIIEDAAGTDFTIPLPRHARPGLRAIAAFLFLLAGPGRDPSDEWKKRRRQQSAADFLEAPPLRQ